MANDMASIEFQATTNPGTVDRTTCCIVGGGPAGMMLALLLARKGVPVTLLEAHQDFDRQFRGDTLHPTILEILDQIGLAQAVHGLPHTKWFAPTFLTPDGPFTPIDLRRLKTRFPYIMLVPQERFLGLLATEARRYSNFHLILGANVERLIEENGAVRGVRYRTPGGWHEVRALLTVGADGRFSRLRNLAHLPAQTLSPPVELLWFRLPRRASDVAEFDALPAAIRAAPLAVVQGEHGTASAFVRWAIFFRRCAELDMVVLVHTGHEHSAPVIDKALAGPRRLEFALDQGCTIVACHAGTGWTTDTPDQVPEFLALLKRYPKLWGDTAVLGTAGRVRDFNRLLDDPLGCTRLLHGSDFPFPAAPSAFASRIGESTARKLDKEMNWLKKDFALKEALGVGRASAKRAFEIARANKAK